MEFYDGNGNHIPVSGGDRVLTHKIVENPNLAKPDAFTVGLFDGAGNFTSAIKTGACSDYIPVTSGKVMSCGFIHKYSHNPWFVATRWCEYCHHYVFYADDKETIVAHGGISLVEGSMTGVAVPEKAAYVRVSWAIQGGGYYFYPVETPEKCFVHLADEPTTAPMYWFANNIERKYIPADLVGYTYPPRHLGKTWVLFGDSITDGHDGCGGYDWDGDNWVSWIAREMGLVVDNRGKSGSNMCIATDGYASVSGVYMLNAFLDEIEAGTIEQPEYITIGFGGNGYNTYVGNVEDTSEKTSLSYYGATKYFIEKLREKCPNSVFGFVLPHDINWGSNQSKQAGVPLCREAIKAVCDEYRVPYINMYTESGITSDMLNDGVHIWNKQPMNLYYHAMRRFMMGL